MARGGDEPQRRVAVGRNRRVARSAEDCVDRRGSSMFKGKARNRSVAIEAGGVRGDLHEPCCAGRYRSRLEVHRSWSTAHESSGGGSVGHHERGAGVKFGVRRENVALRDRHNNIVRVLVSRTREEVDGWGCKGAKRSVGSEESREERWQKEC